MNATSQNTRSGSGFFTVAQMALALGHTRRGIELAMAGILPDSRVVTRFSKGHLASAWRFSSLPSRIRESLARVAERKGYRSAEHLISDPPKRWQPPIPLNQIASQHIERATRLQRALRLALALQNDESLSDHDRHTRGLTAFCREMGKMSAKQFHRLLMRTIERDAGEERWDDVALYLGENITRANDPVKRPVVGDDGERRILDYLTRTKNPQAPTAQERDLVWCVACEEMGARIEAGEKPKAVRRALVRLLSASHVVLAKNADEINRTLKRKYAMWKEGGMTLAAIADKRHEKSGYHRVPVISEEERIALIAHTLNCGGRESQAFREMRESGQLSDGLMRHYDANPASKSYVPQTIRAAITPDVKRLDAIHHGPREHKLRGAYHSRDWSGVAAGDWFTSDDVTAPVLFYTDTEHGVELMRGQFLPMADERTTFILGFVLITEPNYNSLAIRSLITRVCSRHGLPRRGFAFERGIWQSSKILTGNKNALSWEVADSGLRSLGLQFRHAKLPRGKVIENTIGLLQNQMERLPGYVGRDERHDRFERVQRAKLDVEARRVLPQEKFLSEQEITDAYFRIIEEFNNTPQQGRKLNGMTPREGWLKLQASEPRTNFDSRCLHLLAHDRRKLKIGPNGITFSVGKRRFNYKGEETGKRQGEYVLAWFNPDVPEMLACTDMEQREVFTVPRSYDMPAVDATAEQLADENAKIAAHNDYTTRLYRIVQNELPATAFRLNRVDAKTANVGSEITAQRAQLTERQRAETQRRNKVTAKASRLGIAPGILNAQAEETNEGLDMILSALERRKQGAAEEHQPGTANHEH